MLQTSPFLIQLSSGKGTNTLTEEILRINGETVSVACLPDGLRTFTCKGRRVVLAELFPRDNAGEGSACWLSSIAFFATIEVYADTVQNRSVLELGCGVGLGGITSALYGKTETVLLTDIDAALTDVVQQNIEQNGLCNHVQFSNVSYEGLCTHSYDTVDCVLAFDCVYKDNCTEVAQAIIARLRNQGRAIIINPTRNSLQAFLYTLMERGTIETSTIRVEYGYHHLELQCYVFVKVDDDPGQTPEYSKLVAKQYAFGLT